MEPLKISDAELKDLIIIGFGKKKVITESVPFILRGMIKMALPLPKNVKEINLQVKQGNYPAVYDLLQKNRVLGNKGNWYTDCVLVLLCYYRLSKPQEAKQLIEALSHVTYNLPACIMAVAGAVGANYIPKAEGGAGQQTVNMTVVQKQQLHNCPNCKAAINSQTGAYCIHCGTKLH